MQTAGGKAPNSDVLDAFGTNGPAERLSDGEHATWRLDDVVLKPVDISEEQLRWYVSLHDRLRDHADFRVPQVISSRDGRLVVGGWYAMRYLPGHHEARRWLDIVNVGTAFHDAVADEPAPSFIPQCDDPWSIGDRVAWGELSPDDVPMTKHLDRLLGARRPIDARSQLIHGDLSGNVLFDDRLPPAILDLSPYYRPAMFASAIVVADALVWEGADASLVGAFEEIADFGQYLLRALIYRSVTDRLFRLEEPLRPDDDDPYSMPVDLAIRLAGR